MDGRYILLTDLHCLASRLFGSQSSFSVLAFHLYEYTSKQVSVMGNIPYVRGLLLGKEFALTELLLLYTVDPIYHGAWGPSSASAIYPDRDISRGW